VTAHAGQGRVELRLGGDVAGLVGALFDGVPYVVEQPGTQVTVELSDDDQLNRLCHRLRDAGVELLALRRLPESSNPD
jgi:hypothetical protein